ncbi:Transposase and inactivated derivatives-like protein [uncultured Leptolyngbya sp.]|uniref:Transposase and inactivated derivatives-like protein n=2 Tax=Cyanophyceae TaxID=3028117 RepID=A0A6J4Q2I8_9CYAN|nr:Transposase and inactivated derivatives-like protein [uncultured Leptolyngbya sp.]CAA9590409.1 Transposase and inactivated derivatives-like protein [uncultured Synechococcales cyanobacterium]
MSESSLFKWRHYQPDIILCCVRWYLSYPLSYRQVEELITERGLPVDHSTVFRWVQHYSPAIDKRCRRYLRPTNDSWRVDETYIKVKGKWKYLYRAVDSAGNTLDFLLTAKRDAVAAKRFFHKTLKAPHNQQPRVVTVDKNPAYPKAIAELKAEQALPQSVELRPRRYLNNIVEQDHRFIKRLVKLGMEFGSFNTARRTIRGYEVMHMMRKGQVQGVAKGAVEQRIKFISQLFGVAA